MTRGDIIQITDDSHPWRGCLLTVTEPKDFGCQAFVAWPRDDKSVHSAFIRLRYEQCERVGRVALIPNRD